MKFSSIISQATFALLFTQTSAQACNNSPNLCDLPYSNITQLGSHNSPFLRDASTRFSTAGNQFYDSPTQLDAGVRLLSGQVHKSSAGTNNLCHTSCDLLDAGTLTNWLGSIKTWLDSNTNDVVTLLLVNSDGLTAAQFAAEFSAAGIADYAYTPSSKSLPYAWPTLADMIAANKRLVVFIAALPGNDNSAATYPYLLDQFDYMFENDYENTSPTSFSCAPSRPTEAKQLGGAAAVAAGRMALMNHFLYSTQLLGIQTPDVGNISSTNSPSTSTIGSIGSRLAACKQEYSVYPSIVMVDFFNVGPAIGAVDAANGIDNPVGRKVVSTSVPDENTSGAATVKGERPERFAAVVALVVAVGLGGMV